MIGKSVIKYVLVWMQVEVEEVSDRAQFLHYVKTYIQHDPEAAAYVSESVASGLRESLASSNKRAADFECALSLSLNKSKGWRSYALEKVLHWNGRSALDWTSWLKEQKI